MTKELRVWAAALTLALIGAVQACASKPEKPPCTPEAAAEMAAACFLRVKNECVNKGIPQAECTVLDECDAQADARLKECRQ